MALGIDIRIAREMALWPQHSIALPGYDLLSISYNSFVTVDTLLPVLHQASLGGKYALWAPNLQQLLDTRNHLSICNEFNIVLRCYILYDIPIWWV